MSAGAAPVASQGDVDTPRVDYVTGGTLRPDAPSYVERQADADLYEGLSRGEFCYVLTPRQMGKSSLMGRTAARLRAAGAAVAVLDLARIGQNLSPEQWYDGLLGLVGQQLDLDEELEAFWLAHERLGPLQRWMAALRDVVLARCPGPVVIFVDEIDVVQSLPFSADEFFAAIRECYNRRGDDPEYARLTFCLLGVASPADLIDDIRITPFNIGRRIELADFGAVEAVPLARGLGRQGKLAEALLARVLYWTGGHPYLTQRLCQAVADDASVTESAGVDRLCEALFLSTRARERDDNLLFVRDRLLRSEVDLSSLLSLYAQVRRGRRVPNDEANPLVSLLRLSGITRAARGLLRVRNRIYEQVFDNEWVRTSLPDAELRRQRAAYRRGLLRTAAVSAVVIAVVSGLALSERAQSRRADRQQRLAVAQQHLAEERERTARRYLYAAHMNLAQQAWEVGNVGRALDLLEAHRPEPGQEDLRGFEWRYLWRLCQAGARRTFRGHKDVVGAVAFSPDGKTIASASGDHTVKLWDATSGRESTTIKGGGGVNLSGLGRAGVVTFSPDGRTLATGSDDSTVKLWDVGSRGVVATLHLRAGIVEAILFSPNGRILATATQEGTVELWEMASRRELAALKGAAAPLAFSPNGQTLAAQSSAGFAVKLWDVASYRLVGTLQGHTGDVESVAFSPNERTLATGSSDNTIRLWDTRSMRRIATFPASRGLIFAITFSPDGQTLATGGTDCTIKLWDVRTRRERTALKGHTGKVTSVAFSPDGKSLVSGSFDGTAKVWNVVPKRDTAAFRGHHEWVDAVAFSPDGKTVASGGVGTVVKLWDAATKRELATLKGGHTGWIWDVAFSPDGKTLASGSVDTTVKLWDVATKREIATLRGHKRDVTSLAFSPDGKLLATGSQDHMIKLWDVATHRRIVTLQGHKEGEGDVVAFSPDGKTLASGGADRIVKLWDVASRQEIGTLLGHRGMIMGVAFSPDGKTLATSSWEGAIKLWDLATRKEMVTLNGHTADVPAVAFSPDGRTLASAGADSTVKLWNLAARQEVATLTGHTAPVRAVAFSPDGNTLASASGDTTVRLWHAATLAESDAAVGLGSHTAPTAMPNGRAAWGAPGRRG